MELIFEFYISFLNTYNYLRIAEYDNNYWDK